MQVTTNHFMVIIRNRFSVSNEFGKNNTHWNVTSDDLNLSMSDFIFYSIIRLCLASIQKQLIESYVNSLPQMNREGYGNHMGTVYERRFSPILRDDITNATSQLWTHELVFATEGFYMYFVKPEYNDTK